MGSETTFFETLKGAVIQRARLNKVTLIVYLSVLALLNFPRLLIWGSVSGGVWILTLVISIILIEKTEFKLYTLTEAVEKTPMQRRCDLSADILLLGAPVTLIALVALIVSLTGGMTPDIAAESFFATAAFPILLAAFGFMSAPVSRNGAELVFRMLIAGFATSAFTAMMDHNIHTLYYGMPADETQPGFWLVYLVIAAVTVGAAFITAGRAEETPTKFANHYLAAMISLVVLSLVFFINIIGAVFLAVIVFCISHLVVFRGISKENVLKGILTFVGSLIFFSAFFGIYYPLSNIYTDRVPSVDEIESAGFLHYNNLFGDEYSYEDALSSATDFTSRQNVQDIIETHKLFLENNPHDTINEKAARRYDDEVFRLFNNNLSYKYSISYRLKSGETIVRYYVWKGDSDDLPAGMLEESAFYENKYGPLSGINENNVEKVRIKYGLLDDFAIDDKPIAGEILNAIKQDVRGKAGKGSDSLFTIKFTHRGKTYFYPVYEDYSHTLDKLKELGILRSDGSRNYDSPYAINKE